MAVVPTHATSLLSDCSQQVIIRKRSVSVDCSWRAENSNCKSTASYGRASPFSSHCQRHQSPKANEAKSAVLTCPEVEQTLPLLTHTGIVPQGGTSPLESGPAAGIVPRAAAFQKLRKQSNFDSITSEEFISLYFQSLFPLLLLFFLYLALETQQKPLVKLRNCRNYKPQAREIIAPKFFGSGQQPRGWR